ncbi:MAG: tetratricopeptide repeat protein [Proteobacteria bacterium]|nr:tetratricopeptide repeat protein [Pseudomonadota bacterium]
MSRPVSMRACLAACVLAVLAAMPASARRHDPEKIPVTRIRDLHYGDVLFYYFQRKDFEALTHLLAYEHWSRMPHHEDEARLLAGGMYLDLGMHNEAGEIFESVLTRDVPTGVRNRAWFYLANVWYARGYLDKAEAALRKIQGRMSPDLEAQKELLYGNVLMREGRFDEAIQLLSGWRGEQPWSAYARFNLGVALVRAKRLNDADPFLSGVGNMLPSTTELAALRDRANLALGYAYLQAEEPARARAPLSRVRLNGPYSDKALLGLGWADSALGDYQGALTPWMELRGRNVLDSAVQEAYLAVPYAFSKLNANAQSAEYYESAVNSFESENGRLDGAIASIEKGDMLSRVLGKDEVQDQEGSHYGWFWQLKNLPDAPESRYLYAVLAGHDFQEGLKNYRDMVYLSGTLEKWDGDMVAFEDMITTREAAFAERLPRADALLASDAVGKLQQRDVALENQLRAIEAQHDVAALGTATEREQWARIQRIEAALNAPPEGGSFDERFRSAFGVAPPSEQWQRLQGTQAALAGAAGAAGTADTPETAELRARLALVKGVLQYRLNEAYGARLWQEHRSLKDLSLALNEAQSRWIRVERARKNMPANTGEFAGRVAHLKKRIEALQVRLVATEQKQSEYLAKVAVDELEQQKDRLAAYQVQARFALATMYDRAANDESSRPQKPAAPVQKGAESDEPQDAEPPK